MRTLKGPGISLEAISSFQLPFRSLDDIAKWVSSLGYYGIELPTWNSSLFDMALAAESQDYCDEVKGMLLDHQIAIVALSTQRQGQLVATSSVYDQLLDRLAPLEFKGDAIKRQIWATEQMILAAKASANLGLNRHFSSTGSLAWPFIYPQAHQPSGLIGSAFDELALRWRPILDVFDDYGVDLCFELQPGRDLFDGITYEMFLARLNNHPRCNILYNPSHLLLQKVDYLNFIDIYQSRIKGFHVQDAVLLTDGRQGVYSHPQYWEQSTGGLRPLGHGQVDFPGVFSKMAINDFNVWATLSPTCWLKQPKLEAKDGAKLLSQFIIITSEHQADDCARDIDTLENQRILGLYYPQA